MIRSMPKLFRTTVGLRVVGDTLDPDEITRLLGIVPTGSARKGDVRRTAADREVTAQSGSWRLDADVPGDLNTQIGSLLSELPSNPIIWRELTHDYECDVFCGLFMREGNEGVVLTPEVMSMLVVRGLRLGLDIYGGLD